MFTRNPETDQVSLFLPIELLAMNLTVSLDRNRQMLSIFQEERRE